jgi:hypothetical protein
MNSDGIIGYDLTEVWKGKFYILVGDKRSLTQYSSH